MGETTEEKLARLDAELKAFYKLMDDRKEAYDLALTLSARETQRRLEILNNENARIAIFQSQTVLREVYERDLQYIHDSLRRLEKATNHSAGEKKGRDWGMGVIIMIMATLGAALINYLLR